MRTRGALALRSPGSWNPCSRWPPLPLEPPSLSHRAGAPQPPRATLAPSFRRSVLYILLSVPAAWMEDLVAIPVENQKL
eukprot:6189165-Pleurochrysis_carterae.AAC.5